MQDQMRTQPQEVTLKGCVQSEALETAFVLQNAHALPAPVNSSAQPRPASPAGPITEGSIVQLMPGSADLRPHVGKEVTVRGTIADTGENTIGTAGTQGNQVPSGDRSMAAERSKDFEEKKKVRVLEITPTGAACSTAQDRER